MCEGPKLRKSECRDNFVELDWYQYQYGHTVLDAKYQLQERGRFVHIECQFANKLIDPLAQKEIKIVSYFCYNLFLGF